MGPKARRTRRVAGVTLDWKSIGVGLMAVGQIAQGFKSRETSQRVADNETKYETVAAAEARWAISRATDDSLRFRVRRLEKGARRGSLALQALQDTVEVVASRPSLPRKAWSGLKRLFGFG